MVLRWAARTIDAFSLTGLALATLFFCASLTPSLIPRDSITQGILSGLSFSCGYGVGIALRALWTYMELPRTDRRRLVSASRVIILACLAAAVIFLIQASGWQDSIRILMGMEPANKVGPFEVAAIALATFAVVILVARLLASVFRTVAKRLRPHVPRRVAGVIGLVVTALLFWSLVDGVLLRFAIRAMDSSYRELDQIIDAEIKPPTDPRKTGSAASLINWQGLGKMGRNYIASAPTGNEIASQTSPDAKEPIRVYAGLNSAKTAKDRARLALDELVRVGGFERSALIIITPTGTGWVDPAGIDPVEYLHHGDIASVAIQYSYLPSWLSLLVEPGYGSEASRALFTEVYGYWKELPKDRRPKLYLYGLSLGAMNSDLSSDIYDVIADPYQGAVWAGPPFPSRTWKTVTAGRIAGSPAWLPRFRDGSVIRFTSQHNALGLDGAPWGPIRVVYLQYASDPIVFFDPHAAYSKPDWMKGERGPDVSPRFRWFPIVTLLQLTVDIGLGTTTPMGYGHVYAPEHYIDAWIAVTQPPGWTAEKVEALKAFFVAQRKAG
ncbi:alpha/beta hydrolase [Mesorhizobium sp. NPDC059025]|uniref:alpha/beta hydrolase n=1 Tax=unclassified Mesorhizobium TaxID=325217 RepID=UPI0036701C03